MVDEDHAHPICLNPKQYQAIRETGRRGGRGGRRGRGREKLIQEEHKHPFHEGILPSIHFRGEPNTCSNATDTEALN